MNKKIGTQVVTGTCPGKPTAARASPTEYATSTE